MDKLYMNSVEDPDSQEELFESLINIRDDVVMIATYDMHNNNTGIWSNYDTKEMIYTNLSLYLGSFRTQQRYIDISSSRSYRASG